MFERFTDRGAIRIGPEDALERIIRERIWHYLANPSEEEACLVASAVIWDIRRAFGDAIDELPVPTQAGLTVQAAWARNGLPVDHEQFSEQDEAQSQGASWPDRWSEAEEELYALMDRESWAQHFHCGWDEGDTWRDPRAISEGDGMCGKEWAERQGVAAIANLARRRS